MIHLQGKLPRKLYLACSGGVDSMAALDFLRRNHDVEVLHVNHREGNSNRTADFVEDYCNTNGIVCHIHTIDPIDSKPTNMSMEEWWRDQRYRFLDQGVFGTNAVVTCHHLDDCVETWIWSSLNGTGKIIPYRRGNVVRPFRLTRKRDFEYWCSFNQVPWIEDDSNQNIHYTRNYIRQQMMPHVLQVNPGIHKTIAKKVNKDDVE